MVEGERLEDVPSRMRKWIEEDFREEDEEEDRDEGSLSMILRVNARLFRRRTPFPPSESHLSEGRNGDVYRKLSC